MKRVCLAVSFMIAAMGCSVSSSDDSSSSSEALTQLTAAECSSPNVTTGPKLASSGRPIVGSAQTTLRGCVLGRAAENGAALSERVATLLSDTSRIGQVRKADGSKVFASFRPGRPRGSLDTELVQDIDVELAMDYSPSARIRTVRKRASDGSYSLSITNVTPFEATLLLLPVTVIAPQNLTFQMSTSPEANGVRVTGKGAVLLDVQQEQASNAAEIVTSLFEWLTDELRR